MITYPLNNIEYTAEDAELYNATRASGVFDGEEDFDIAVAGGNKVTIKEGLAWIHNSKFTGKAVANKTSETLDLGLPDNNYDRIDAIVIQYNSIANATKLIVKKGKAETSPKPPQVIRTASTYELHLYHVRRKTGAVSITTNDITDLRNDPTYCGKMYDAVTPKDFITPLEQGGTGATTAKQARTNLGFYYGTDEPNFVPSAGEGSIYFRIKG